MEYKIQSLVLPNDEKHRGCRKLFYRGDHAILDTEKQSLTLGFGQRCDFVTYLNACNLRKWQKYTHTEKVKLHLEIEGKAEITFLGYSKESLAVERVEFDTLRFDKERRSEIVYEFPENNEQMVGLEITALSSACKIFGGYYATDIKKSQLNDVVLSLATTTCRKEDFIKKNVEMIKSEIIDVDDEMAKNFYLHVVDNGRTLATKDVHGKHVSLHSNINAGGAGGFARGMIESLRQQPKATHVLLMDDDVLVLPESIRRTYNLLRILKPEHKNSFISGAMLYYESPENQHEDIGTIGNDCTFRSLKDGFDQSTLSDNLENERDFTQHKNAYAAWWFCCIPTTTIEKNGLPLPIFIRCDDMEYSLRAKPKFITMNGICVWHMGFATKYNTTFDKYQQYRNLLIAQATTGVIPEVDIPKVIYDSFRIEIMRFNYDAAELVIEALEDFLKGPEFIKNVNGEDIANEHFKLNDQLVPLSELPEGNLFRRFECYENPPLSFKNRVLMKLTWNGQRWCPKFLENDEVVPIGFDWNIQSQRIAMHAKLIAVNPYNETGVYRIKDRERFRELMQRYKRAVRNYRERHASVCEAYRENRNEMTSEGFWQKYLGLGEEDDKS